MALSFIFDTGKGETPQSVARKRALAAAIMSGMGPRPARNANEGIGNALASIGQGIQSNVLNRRANAAETAGQDSASSALSSLFFPSAPSAPMSSPSMPSSDEQQPTMDYASSRVDAAHGGASSGDLGWLTYANEGATRNLPLSDKLTSALGFLPELGVTMEVFSGGQPEAGKGPR